jgi:hypothetical protein
MKTPGGLPAEFAPSGAREDYLPGNYLPGIRPDLSKSVYKSLYSGMWR